ncbi:MAG: DUF1330 domain-containing protein [Pseudomonadota bacterium]
MSPQPTQTRWVLTHPTGPHTHRPHPKPKGDWIVHVTVTNPDAYADYIRLDTPIVERFNGHFIVRGGQNETPETKQKDRHVIVEFRDYATALACDRSDDDQQAAAIRRANADSDIVIIEGTA